MLGHVALAAAAAEVAGEPVQVVGQEPAAEEVLARVAVQGQAVACHVPPPPVRAEVGKVVHREHRR